MVYIDMKMNTISVDTLLLITYIILQIVHVL